jgi:hypothetical protein
MGQWAAAGVSIVFSEWLLMSLRHRDLAPLDTHEVTNLINASRGGSPSFPRSISGSRGTAVADDRKTPAAASRTQSQNSNTTASTSRPKSKGEEKRNA